MIEPPAMTGRSHNTRFVSRDFENEKDGDGIMHAAKDISGNKGAGPCVEVLATTRILEAGTAICNEVTYS